MDAEAAFERHHEALFRYLNRLTGDEDVAADLAQEAFVRLLDAEIPADRAKSWLFTVGTNLVRDRARVRGRRQELLREYDPPRSEPPEPDEAVERSETVTRVRAALEELAERDREMLLLREEGFKYVEIAETVGVATGSVGTLLARALRRFEEAYRSSAPESQAEGSDGPAEAEDGARRETR